MREILIETKGLLINLKKKWRYEQMCFLETISLFRIFFIVFIYWPYMCEFGSTLGRNEILVLLHHWKIRSSSAFECGITSTNSLILDWQEKRSTVFVQWACGVCIRPPEDDIEIKTWSQNELQGEEQEYLALGDLVGGSGRDQGPQEKRRWADVRATNEP